MFYSDCQPKQVCSALYTRSSRDHLQIMAGHTSCWSLWIRWYWCCVSFTETLQQSCIVTGNGRGPSFADASEYSSEEIDTLRYAALLQKRAAAEERQQRMGQREAQRNLIFTWHLYLQLDLGPTKQHSNDLILKYNPIATDLSQKKRETPELGSTCSRCTSHSYSRDPQYTTALAVDVSSGIDHERRFIFLLLHLISVITHQLTVVLRLPPSLNSFRLLSYYPSCNAQLRGGCVSRWGDFRVSISLLSS